MNSKKEITKEYIMNILPKNRGLLLIFQLMGKLKQITQSWDKRAKQGLELWIGI